MSRIVISYRTRCTIQFPGRYKLIIFEAWRADSIRVAHKANSTGSDTGKMRTRYGGAAVITGEEDCVSSQIMKIAIFQRAIFRTFKHHGTTPIDHPVRAEQRFVFIHKSTQCLCQFDSLYSNVSDRLLFRTAEFNQMLEYGSLEDGCFCVFVRHGIII